MSKFLEVEETLSSEQALTKLPLFVRQKCADDADAEKKLQKLEQNEFKGKLIKLKIKLMED